ncbi:phospholipase D-like domain-containing protein [Helicobacter mustelae]|nr:phospholipase D-like domain-containing protein [Helicobacter mustelae]
MLLLCCLCFLMGQDRIYFMPYENKEALHALKAVLSSAQKSIHIAIYSFTNKEIAKVLRDQAKKGVKISIIYDQESNLKDSFSTIGYLGALRNIDVCLLQGLQAHGGKRVHYGIMHQKLVIVDDRIVVLGSANWSKSAFANNYENLFITQQPNIVQKSQFYFQEMRGSCKPY